MIKDDNYPDLFFEVLGPSFGAQYPSLFKKSRGDEAEDGETEEQLNGEFHEELMKYNESVKNYRTDQKPVSYTHLRAHETVLDLVCRLLLEKKKTKNS